MAYDYVIENGGEACVIALVNTRFSDTPSNWTIDHAFALIGKKPPDNDFLTQPFNFWPNHLYISDPWANVVCAPHQYPVYYKDTLRRWEENNKRVKLNEKHTDFILPYTGNDIGSSVENLSKAVLYAYKRHPLAKRT